VKAPWDRSYQLARFGGGGSSSSSSSSTTTEQYDQRVAADGYGIAVGSGADVQVNYQDPDSVQDLIEVFGSLGESVLVNGQATIERAFGLVESNTAKVVDLYEKRTQTEATTIAQDALKVGVPIVIAGLIVWGVKK